GELKAPGAAERGPRRLRDQPRVARGKAEREDLPGAEPRRIQNEDRPSLGQPDDREHPQQRRVLRPLTIERRNQARETRRANRDRDVQSRPERNAAAEPSARPAASGYATAPTRRLQGVGGPDRTGACLIVTGSEVKPSGGFEL